MSTTDETAASVGSAAARDGGVGAGGTSGHRATFRRVREWFWWHSVWQHLAAPVWLRVHERRRWQIVALLDKSKRQCWADLVSDALTYRESDPCNTHVPRLGGSGKACASACGWHHPEHAGEHECSCYCGKFQFIAAEGIRDREAAS